MTTETTALTVIQRAAVALDSSKAEAELTALALQSQSITAITNPAGRTECHAAAMVAKGARVSIEKAGKAARDDATAFAKAVIAEQSRLVGLIEPEETRLLALRDDYDSKLAREKAEKAEAERLRIAGIQQRINAIKAIPMLCATSTSEVVQHDIDRLSATEIDDSFAEFYGEAVEAKAASLAKLREIHAAKVAAEVEAARVRDELAAQAEQNRIERAELERQRDEQRRIAFEAQEKQAAELQRLAAERAEIAAAHRALDEAKAAEAARISADAAAAQKVIDDAAAEAKRDADAVAAKELRELAAQRATEQAAEYAEQQRTASVPAIAVEQPAPVLVSKWLADLNVLTGEMTDNEGVRLVHYGRRLIAERQVAA